MPVEMQNATSLQSVVCIVGPTASGKSDMAQILASRISGEVLSADSMQIYKGMDIGTGKVPIEERIVPHWGLDLVNPGDEYSAALYQEYGRGVISLLDEAGKRTVLCGGTGLYVRAVIDDYDFPAGEQEENPVREKYTAYAQEHGEQALWDLLNTLDPESAAVIHPHNVRRVVRAFELREEGKSYAVQKENLHSIPQKLPAIMFGLSVDREVLLERIYRRVDSMIEQGLLQEVENLLQAGFREGVTAPQAIGYKELVEYLDGHCAIEAAIEQIKIATRRYAKRQRSWFNQDTRIIWLNANNASAEELASQAYELLVERGVL